MSAPLNREKVHKHLRNANLSLLFIEELGWDFGAGDIDVEVAGHLFTLKAVAQKRGMVAYQYIAEFNATFPDYPTRQKIEKVVARTVREHIIVYVTHDSSSQYWQWIKREPGRPDQSRLHSYHRSQPGEALIQKLENIAFTLDEEGDLTIVDVSGRVRAAFDVEKVTKKFYDRFKNEHSIFLNFISGIQAMGDREWYASLMLNRMMFIYFIQKRGFLDNDIDYLRNRLERMQEEHGPNRFQTFYRLFLLRLFHEGLSQPAIGRDPGLANLLGKVPYLNGGLFDVHDLERDNEHIDIPDNAFQQIFQFFDAYQWHLDDRPLHKDNEINPDVLGYIFEKYINQKQMGAYYTKEDITGYISRNAIIPFLFHRAKNECPTAFEPDCGIWRLLSDDPDRYFYESVRHGITHDIWQDQDISENRELPPDIAAGLDDVSLRDGWNSFAPDTFGLANETWREHIARRKGYEETRDKLAAGDVMSINDLITYNLDIEKFVLDVITGSEGPELIRAFWKSVTNVSVLDPTCGSGAFLFAALNILEPIYVGCLEAMQGFLDDLERTGRKHCQGTMRDFRNTLKRVSEHSSERYFIQKSIIVNNLYGVDIMEEAVEICKLRLFLKLVSQLENYEQIEPLPDIDFNIRPGNTLVGFTSLDEVKRATATDMFAKLAIPGILERAEIADKTFQNFQNLQTVPDMDAIAFSDAKSTLRARLDELREELDCYLADEFGVDTKDKVAYELWRKDHQPFHWFVEFHGIMLDDGFDVVIGNPPYLEARQVPYSTKFFKTECSGAIHAMCIERSLALYGQNGCISMIVPLALVSTQRMTVLQKMLERNRDCWYSNFSWRPGKLFDTVNRALTVFVAVNPHKDSATFSTSYLRWNSVGRSQLFSTLRYIRCPKRLQEFWVPKLGQNCEASILEKCMNVNTTMEDFTGRSQNRIFYRTTGGLYWKIFTNFEPKFRLAGIDGSSSRMTRFTLKNASHIKSTIAILSSDVFWWWYTITSNLRDLNPTDWKSFPVPRSAINDVNLCKLGSDYIEDLKANSTMRVRNQKSTGKTETQTFKIQRSKKIIDEIDNCLAAHYGFSEEEVDFIINYDIKYRVGLSKGA